MSATDLSAEQTLAVRASLRDVCVTAGAGSGKTRVLTERFVEHIVAHRLPARRVAALTFTEKAAREMRTRIASAVASLGDREARLAIEGAPISTLHAFCARLLRRNAVAAGIDPAFRVLDATGALLLRKEARARAAERLLARPDAVPTLEALERLCGVDPFVTAERLLERVRGAGGNAAAIAWRPGAKSAGEARAEVDAALAAFEAEAAALSAPLTEAARFAALARAALSGDRGAARLLTEPTKLLKPSGKTFKALRDARDALAGALEGWRAAVLDDVAEREVLPAVRAVLVELDEAARRLKSERTALDFTDLERETLRLLTALAARDAVPEGAPAALLVDEHQDTNPVQEAILVRLRALGAPQFSVGDPKQSIYRFRRADVRVLTDERERVGVDGRRTLAESYRAAPEVVDALNGLFEHTFADGSAGVPFEPLVARGRFAASASDAPAVEMALLDRGALGAEEGRRREAAFAVERLRALVADGTPRRKGAGSERLRFGCCAVLVQARAMMPYYEDALSARGIPYRVHKGRGYLEAEEIQALIHALRAVHNPKDEYALACLLRGPALGATDADLLRWFGAGGAWERLAADPEPAAARLAAELTALRRTASGGSLPETVTAVVERLRLLEAVLRQPDGPRRAANLRRAVALAEEVAAAGCHDLPGFLRHLEELESIEAGQGEAPALDGADDAVSLLTVHGAKGLEWPVVVVGDIGRRPKNEDDAAYVEGTERVAFRIRDPLEGDEEKPAGYEALRQAEARAAAQERLRLLYVAATRAEERLLLVGTYAGVTQDGQPKDSYGWARALFHALNRPLTHGVEDVAVGAGRVRLTIAPVPPDTHSAPLADGAAFALASDATAADVSADVEALLREADRNVAPLGGTRFVVGVSELLAFARSPAALYAARFAPDVFRGEHRSLSAERAPVPVPPATVPEAEPDPAADPEGRAERRAALAPWDEPVDSMAGAPDPPPVDRAGLGRAVHALLERWTPGAAVDVADALAEEFPAGVPAHVQAVAADMVARFARSRVAARLTRALADLDDVRREPAFHARIRFPAGVRVGAFDALLVKGTIDLWLPDGGDVRLVDFKTNAPSRTLPTPEALAEHYGWQMRLYALAAERLLGRDVAGASLLLLHPAWGPEAVEVPVDVSGPQLEEARRLCQAFALAELDDRWPADWRTLLASV